jgi:hypothetical protein
MGQSESRTNSFSYRHTWTSEDSLHRPHQVPRPRPRTSTPTRLRPTPIAHFPPLFALPPAMGNSRPPLPVSPPPQLDPPILALPPPRFTLPALSNSRPPLLLLPPPPPRRRRPPPPPILIPPRRRPTYTLAQPSQHERALSPPAPPTPILPVSGNPILSPREAKRDKRQKVRFLDEKVVQSVHGRKSVRKVVDNESKGGQNGLQRRMRESQWAADSML